MRDMLRAPTWRKIGTALAALVLTLLTFGPGIDSLICKDEGGMTAAAAEAVLTVAGDFDASHTTDHAAPCVHGHCHHGATYVGNLEAQALEAVEPPPAAHPLVRGRVPTSDPKFGLIRPPRA